MKTKLQSLILGLALCAGLHQATAQVILNPNQIQGNLRFTNTNPAILAILGAPGNFGIGGFTDSGSWEAGGGGWFNYFVVISIETTIYIAFSFWANRRLHRAAWAEIESGRWTPPTVA